MIIKSIIYHDFVSLKQTLIRVDWRLAVLQVTCLFFSVRFRHKASKHSYENSINYVCGEIVRKDQSVWELVDQAIAAFSLCLKMLGCHRNACWMRLQWIFHSLLFPSVFCYANKEKHAPNLYLHAVILLLSWPCDVDYMTLRGIIMSEIETYMKKGGAECPQHRFTSLRRLKIIRKQIKRKERRFL